MYKKINKSIKIHSLIHELNNHTFDCSPGHKQNPSLLCLDRYFGVWLTTLNANLTTLNEKVKREIVTFTTLNAYIVTFTFFIS
jgi:hypothetical protein